ncbi:MAG: NUDIX hydrolase [Candidatus Nanoarchaeia archaeon]|jgi:hypothetical protein
MNKILAYGFKNVSYCFRDIAPNIPKDINYKLHEYISGIESDKKKQGKLFFNAGKIHLFEYGLNKDSLYLNLGKTDYFTFDFLSKNSPELLKNYSHVLSTGALLLTNDGKIILGNKSKLNDKGEGEYHLPSGYIELSDLGDDLRAAAVREASEEVFDNKDLISKIQSISPLGLFNKEYDQPMLAYVIQLKIDENEVFSVWENSDAKKREFSQLKFVPADKKSICQFLDGNKIRAHARVSLENFLRTL